MDSNRAESERKPNRLINEQSPYLRQHAYNPVDWYPWGEEALARAKAEDKPILLSIGYSACHWCHVMERESFENEDIARLMNEKFVCIKVDREERPDLDQIYMDAVQLIVNRGGWPLTAFLTPAGEPFYGGTYFPPEDRQGMPGFPRVLEAIDRHYREETNQLKENAERLRKALNGFAQYSPPDGSLKPGVVRAAAEGLAEQYDSVNGGFGNAPKFPHATALSLFLRVHQADDDLHYGDMVHETLAKMAAGGIYDQIGGGFHRYSVDEQWMVPHFEKMLYDNALLAKLYLDAGRALNEPDFLSVARETLEYVLREMTSPDGGFYSSQDADSEGEEGKFFTWTPAQIRDALEDERLARIAEHYFGVSEEGNFEGANILHRATHPAAAAIQFEMPEEEMADAINVIKARLLAAREKRVRPGRDDKILAAWNGLMIGAFAEAYRALGDPRYLAAAEAAADRMMTRLWDGRSLKRSLQGGAARFNAYLEDYALLAGAMIDLYEASLKTSYLAQARVLVDVVLERFVDSEKGGFFFTADNHEALITRPKAAFDGSIPSGASAAAMALLRLHEYTGETRYFKEAERTIALMGEFVVRQASGFAYLLEAIDLYQRGATEIVLLGEPGDQMSEWLERLGRLYLPNRALFVMDPDSPEQPFMPEQVRGKSQQGGHLTAYICRERTCSAPIVSIGEMLSQVSE